MSSQAETPAREDHRKLDKMRERNERSERQVGRQEEDIYLTRYHILGTNLSFGFIQEICSAFKFMEWRGVDLMGF